MERMIGGAVTAAGAMATGQDDSDGYYGASKGTAYNNPYGNQGACGERERLLSGVRSEQRRVRTRARVARRRGAVLNNKQHHKVVLTVILITQHTYIFKSDDSYSRSYCYIFLKR